MLDADSFKNEVLRRAQAKKSAAKRRTVKLVSLCCVIVLSVSLSSPALVKLLAGLSSKADNSSASDYTALEDGASIGTTADTLQAVFSSVKTDLTQAEAVAVRDAAQAREHLADALGVTADEAALKLNELGFNEKYFESASAIFATVPCGVYSQCIVHAMFTDGTIAQLWLSGTPDPDADGWLVVIEVEKDIDVIEVNFLN